jgi:hypothetical protein
MSEGDIDAAFAEVPDDMVKTFVAVGNRDQVLEKIEPMWGVGDSMCPAPPSYFLPPEKVQFYVGGIGAMIAEQLN